MCIFVITKFKLFESTKFYSNKIGHLSDHLQRVFNTRKFEIGEPVRFKDKGDLIFYIDYIEIIGLDCILYHVKDDRYIYEGLYQDFQLEKLSDDEKNTLKYNL